MTTIKGYKLVCELCGCQSEELWGATDPDKVKLVTKEYYEDYKCRPNYVHSYYEHFDRNVFLPEDWYCKTLSRPTKEEEDRYTLVHNPFLNIWSSVPLYEKTYTYFIGDEDKNIYFCSEEHKASWERLKANCDWK